MTDTDALNNRHSATTDTLTLTDFIEAEVDSLAGETWRAIPGYERDYAASSLGRVVSRRRRTTRGGILKASANKRGYLSVALCRDGEQRTHEVHRLVALAFFGPRPEGHEVRHLDGDRLNAAVANLAYGTPSENGRDKRRHGTDYNLAKECCPQGHPYSGDNLLTAPSRPGWRYCRACTTARNRARANGGVADYRAEWAS